MITETFTYKGKTYTINIPEVGIDPGYIPWIEELNDSTGQIVRRFINAYYPNFNTKTLKVDVQKFMVDNNGNNIPATSTLEDSYIRTSTAEFDYFYLQLMDGDLIRKQLLNGLIFNEVGTRIYTESGQMIQPISFTVDVTPATQSAPTPEQETNGESGSINADGSLTVNLQDFDNTQTIMYSIDGGATWQASNTFTGLAFDFEYDVWVKYDGVIMRSMPTPVPYTSYDEVKGEINFIPYEQPVV